MKFLSPAKVNLHLEILGRRPDGYHEIQTLMHRVDLFDEGEITPGGSGIRLTVEGEEIPGGTENLACRAARIFVAEAGLRGDLEIRLKKRIPVGAGLGGGSSDAASVLLELNDLLKVGWERDRLMAIGAKLGADVPFFIFQKPALARGVGEKLTPVSLPEPLWFLLLVPPWRISTAWAYEAYDRLAGGKTDPLKIRDSYTHITEILPVLKNDLELAALANYPEIGQMKEALLAGGAQGAMMTGSGPVVFGLFPGQKEAEQTEKRIPLLPGWKTIICRGI